MPKAKTSSEQPPELVLALPKIKPLLVLSGLAILPILLFGGFALAYRGKVYPGITAHGAYIGGLTREAAQEAVASRTDDYSGKSIIISSNGHSLKLGPASLDLVFDNSRAVEQAYRYGRQGGMTSMAHQFFRALLGRPTNVAVISYDQAKLSPYLSEVAADATRKSENAQLSYEANQASVTPAIIGQRVDIGRLVQSLEHNFSQASDQPIQTPVYELMPIFDTQSVINAKSQADIYLSAPVILKIGQLAPVEIKPETIVSWIRLDLPIKREFLDTHDIRDLYDQQTMVAVGLDEAKIASYLSDIAKKIDRPAIDAALTITDGRATVFRPSQQGYQVDQKQAQIKIVLALNHSTDRVAAADLISTLPTVREESLNDLGIKELISEGVSYFPGSLPERMQNIRVGSALYNGYLLKPDAVFSFGEILGDVGPETGYAPATVILNNRQEKQYGGGLCQVSSTAYRAALLAGLPILQRTNHSFAVSYYTQAFGVPGVDATIYYPQVDMKFKNDTGSHILIQTILSGTTLKFQFYGTKVKEGKIRGPFFISGSQDAKQPSHTVFYRDVVVNGEVQKTDTVHTWYKSSDDFPRSPEFN